MTAPPALTSKTHLHFLAFLAVFFSATFFTAFWLLSSRPRLLLL